MYMTLKYKKLNEMMKYIIITVLLAVAVTLLNVGVNVFLALLAMVAVFIIGFCVCLLTMYIETSQMKKLNEKMSETKSVDGYLEKMERIGKWTIWQNIYHQTILNRGTGHINLGEYQKGLEVLKLLEDEVVLDQIRFLEVWNRLFALIELRNYTQAGKIMKKYQKILKYYADSSPNVADRLELYHSLMSGDKEKSLELIVSCREKYKEDPSVMDQMDFYELRIQKALGNDERVAELKASLGSHKVFPCIQRVLN